MYHQYSLNIGKEERVNVRLHALQEEFMKFYRMIIQELQNPSKLWHALFRLVPHEMEITTKTLATQRKSSTLDNPGPSTTLENP